MKSVYYLSYISYYIWFCVLVFSKLYAYRQCPSWDNLRAFLSRFSDIIAKLHRFCVSLCIVINRCRRYSYRTNLLNVQFWSATSAKDTFKHIEAGSVAEITIYFKSSFPYLSRSTSLRPLRAFLFPSSFPPSVFRLGLRFTLLGERMAVRLLGSPPTQIAFARTQNLWTVMIKSCES